jgi:plasmid stabilization system protein ParE
MTGKNILVIWSKRAIKSLKEIYDYYNQFSQKAAINQRDRILKKVSDIKFLEQYQVDELSSNHRRIVVSHYKVVYRFEVKQIRILAIFDSRQDPSKLKM